ncbi:E3 ubiquitin- ligase NRDP1 [Paramuricea clavata]|uniref:E3 ubiquitin- ligase NRDP1 n=1 Tax=Paramuricea clavata TaxID=317549 RepID=A0A6S7JV21_PARCT|nr:E3 ubiquitin- ligase NRDP1 [Paramuricea clavata]
MACCPTEKNYGYDDSRFENDVDQHFHCSICYNVLKEPRMCRNNEHVFCLACISEHLKVNSQTCPECNEHLSVDTLRRPRLVNNYLSKLKINCDYASRGCPEFTCVADLQTHVANCEFAPVFCSNENCGMEINKQDQVHHETEICEYRKVRSYDYGQIQEDIGTVKGSLIAFDGEVEAMEKEMEKNMEINYVAMKRIVGKLEGSLEGMNKRIHEKVEASKKSYKEMKHDQHEVKKEMRTMKENLSNMNKDVDEFKVMMSLMLEKLNMLESRNKLPFPSVGMLNTPKEDILIAGGSGCDSGCSAEIFFCETNGWYEVAAMNERHEGASSFIYNDQLFVVGGKHSKTIETLNLDELPLKWMEFSDELPYAGDDHSTVVYQQRVIHIGGYNRDECKTSNLISELQLTSPCTLKELCQMPQPRDCQGAEPFEDKVLVLGGVHDKRGILDSVLEFDPKKNVCKELPSLPHPMKEMATVRWRDQVVVLGGRDKDDQVLNDVFMYDCKTGQITALPSMLKKRYKCCAVITGNTIVVMGGENDDDYLSSVECFTMGGCTWKYLPSMNNSKCEAVAEVLPSTRLRKSVYV